MYTFIDVEILRYDLEIGLVYPFEFMGIRFLDEKGNIIEYIDLEDSEKSIMKCDKSTIVDKLFSNYLISFELVDDEVDDEVACSPEN